MTEEDAGVKNDSSEKNDNRILCRKNEGAGVDRLQPKI